MNPSVRACFSFVLVVLAAANRVSMFAAEDIESKLGTRDFPSVFLAWSSADNLKNEDPVVTFSRHDLAIEGPEALGLRWNNPHRGAADGFRPATIATGLDLRARLLRLNPTMILVAEVRYRDAPGDYLPEDSPWWSRKDGARAAGWAEGHYFLLNFADPEFRAHVAKQARAIMATGVFDGIFLDWWKDDSDRVALVRAVRGVVGDKALILANANDTPRPLTAPFINGYYMECTRSATPKDWTRIARTLQWAEKMLRQPRVNCVETWYHTSRQDLNLMRATTALALTMSDGYCLFADPDPLPTPDHLHDWYGFWDKSLGKPLAPGIQRGDGSWVRDFEKGTALYNPMGNAATAIGFKDQRRQLSTGAIAQRFTIPACDGELFLRLQGP